MIKEVRIKPGCISCKTCERICPQIFKVDGTSKVIGNQYEKYASSILEAAQNCPVQVILVTDTAAPQAYDEKPSFTAVLLEKKQLTSDTYEFVFSAPDRADFHPGQFATMTLTDHQGSFVRCYSIKSWKEGKIVFCIKILTDGRGGSVLAKINPKDTVVMCPGLGTFGLKKTLHPKLFIATGTGIAPIMAMLDATAAEVPKKLIFGLRNEKDIFYLDELKKYENLDVDVWISQPSPAYKGNVGRVTTPFENMQIPKDTKFEVYICGNPPMVQSVLDILQVKSHPNVDVSYEFFAASTPATPETTQASSALGAALPWMQRVLLIASTLTPLQYFFPESTPFLWDLSLYTVILLMLIRPLRDLFPKASFFSRLIALRKELGIFSASVVASSAAIHYLDPTFSFVSTYFSLDYWSFVDNKFWAHIAELTGVILLITSNSFSQSLLGRHWKRIQRLSYVYFFAGAFYVWASFGKTVGMIGIVAVFALTLLAFLKNKFIKHA